MMLNSKVCVQRIYQLNYAKFEGCFEPQDMLSVRYFLPKI